MAEYDNGPQQDVQPEPQQQQHHEQKPAKTGGEIKDKGPGMISSLKRKVNGGATQLVYVAPISDRIGLAHFLYFQTFPCSFALCNSRELAASTYVHLYEDRLEWNYPASCCATIYDNNGVLYLDRDIAEFQTIPSCCTPFCTHCSCAPTCFDAFGEMLMLSGTASCCFVKGDRPWGLPPMNTPSAYCCYCPMPFCGKPLPCLNKNWVFFPHLKDAQTLKFKIRTQRQKLMQAGHAQTCVNGITM